MIGLVAVTAAGQRAARELAAAWPGQTRHYPGPAGEALRAAFTGRECDGIVAFLATGAAVRLLAPLLGHKSSDPGVVCVDEACRFAVALVGGHRGGANALAERVAPVLGAMPVTTTASDAVGLPGLDSLGWPVQGDVAGVGRAILDGEPVRLEADAVWPLPALPPNVRAGEVPTGEAWAGEVATGEVGARGGCRLLVTDRNVPSGPGVAVLRPPSLVIGLGAATGVEAEEVLDLADRALEEAGLSPECVRAAATVDRKAGEAGLVAAARRRGWPLRTWPAEVLAGQPVPNPSAVVHAEVGTPSVAEAAAMCGGGALVVTKRKSPRATVALARHRPRGRLAVVGLGPGARDLLPERARAELRRASVVVGLDQYVDSVRDLLRPGTRVLATGLGSEEERARSAVEEARAGHAVALIGSGDAGVYAMGSPALEAAGTDIDVVGVPGITAALAAAAVLGAPLGHDSALISLSDLHTPWPAIERRVRGAAEGDFVVCFYNPRSAGRDWQLAAALNLLGQHRPGGTPVGLVRDATRPGQSTRLTTLAEVNVREVDMSTLVVVGSSASRIVAGRMVTPRGYRWELAP